MYFLEPKHYSVCYKNFRINDLYSSSLVGLSSQNLQTTDLFLRSLLLLLNTLLQLVLDTITLFHHHEILLSFLFLIRCASSLQLHLEFSTSFNSLTSSFLFITSSISSYFDRVFTFLLISQQIIRIHHRRMML